jgi:hypothetical protein
VLTIILLALAAAVFPALLACVAILIARPRPRLMLLAFYIGSLLMSLVAGAIVLIAFDRGESVAGSTPSAPHPGESLLEAAFAFALAWLILSGRAGRVLDRWHARRQRRHPTAEPKGPSWMQRRLDRATLGVAAAVGAVINLPGPMYVLALGHIARGDYTTGAQIALVAVFNAIMFVLLEVPLIGYVLAPESTAARIASFRDWLNGNGLRVTGWLVTLFAVGLLAQGLIALPG